MKKCEKCELDTDDFDFPVRKRKGRQVRLNICNICYNEGLSNRVIKKKKYKGRENLARFNRVREMQIQKLKQGCQSCGYNRCSKSLQYHHINPTDKSFDISWGIQRSVSISRLQKELDRCVLLCANCHQEVECGLLEYKDNVWIKKEPEIIKTYNCGYCNKKLFENRFCSEFCEYANDKLPTKLELQSLSEKHSFNSICDILNVTRVTLLSYFEKYSMKPKLDTDKYSPKRKKLGTPNKLELEELVWKYTLTEIGKMYNVSRRSIYEWCKKLDIECPPVNFWKSEKIRKLTLTSRQNAV